MNPSAHRDNRSRKMLLVMDAEGNVAGGFEAGEPDASGVTPSVEALPGQVVREVEIPDEIASIKSGDEFGRALENARIDDKGRLTRGKTQTRREGEPA